MNKRFKEIDSFLREMAEVYKKDPRNFNDKTVYEALKFFNMSEYDKEDCTYEEIESYRMFADMKSLYVPNENNVKKQEWFSEMGFFGYFGKWAFDAGDNIEGRINPENSYFWLFRNTKIRDYESNHNGKTPIKLYIPVGKSTFMHVLPKLFKFLSDNDIMHNSKISAGVRTDDVVVRVYNLSEAEQIIKYVNENFQNQILETNPFILREGLVGITADAHHSYNRDVSIHIVEFIKQNDAKNINLENFRNFIKNNINDFSREDKIVMNILLLALDSKTTINDFFEYWDAITDIPIDSKKGEVNYSKKGINKFDSFDKKIESREYAQGLEKRRKNEIIEKENFINSEKSAKKLEEIKEKKNLIIEVIKEVNEKNIKSNQHREKFHKAMIYLRVMTNRPVYQELNNIINDKNFFNLIGPFEDEIIEYAEQVKKEEEEKIRKKREELELEVAKKEELRKKINEEYEKMKKDPIRWKKYQEEQRIAREKKKKDREEFIAYLREFNGSLDDGVLLKQNLRKVLKIIDDDEAR